MDVDDFLRMMKEETEKESEDEQQKLSDDAVKSMMGMLGMGKMVNLSKAALNRKNALMEELTTYLGELDKTDKASWSAQASAKILSTAKQLGVLDVLVSAGVLSVGASKKEDFDEAVQSIIRVSTIY